MLKFLYGKDTSSTRVLNLLVHLLWCYVIVLNASGAMRIDLPEKIKPSFTLILIFIITNLVVTAFTFVETPFKTKLKYFSLALGALIQTFIAIKYAASFPPFDVMVIVCCLLASWFVGGAVYIKQITETGKTNVGVTK